MLTLEAKKRDAKENLESLREGGIIPAVFYGRKEKSTPIAIKEADFAKIYEEAGESTIISLKEGSDEHEALIHEVNFHPVKGNVLHADFYIIEKGKKLTLNVPIVFEGESPAEKDGNVLVKAMHEVEIEALPRDLPSELLLDISSLSEINDQLHVKDIKLPEGVEFTAELEEVVALIQEPKEEEEEPIVEMDLDSIEVEGEKKEGEESEGGEGAPEGEGGAPEGGEKPAEEAPKE